MEGKKIILLELAISIISILLISILGSAFWDSVGVVEYGDGNNFGREEQKAKGYQESACMLKTNGCSGSGPDHSKVDFSDDFETELPDWELPNGWAIKDVNGESVLRGSSNHMAVLNYNGMNSFAFKASFKRQKGLIHFNIRRNSRPDGLHRYFVTVGGNELILTKQLGQGNFKDLMKTDLNIDYSRWHSIGIEADGPNIRVFIDGEHCICYKDSNPITTGDIAFETLQNSDYLIDDVQVFD